MRALLLALPLTALAQADFDRRDAFRGLRKARSGLERCAAKVSEVRGSLTLSFVVDPEGRVQQLERRDDDLADARTADCLQRSVARTRFPPPAGGSATITLVLFAAEGLAYPIELDLSLGGPTPEAIAAAEARLRAARSRVKEGARLNRKGKPEAALTHLRDVESGRGAQRNAVGPEHALMVQWEAMEQRAVTQRDAACAKLDTRGRKHARAGRLEAAAADLEALDRCTWFEDETDPRPKLRSLIDEAEARAQEKAAGKALRDAERRWPVVYAKARVACQRISRAQRRIRELMMRGREEAAQAAVEALRAEAERLIAEMQVLIPLTGVILENREDPRLRLSPLRVAEKMRALTASCPLR